MAMLTVENINVYYGVIHALKDISFQVNEGEIVALIGANGAGKTTTLQTVSGMLSAKSGSIPVVSQSITRPMVPVGAMTVDCALRNPCFSPRARASSQADFASAPRPSTGMFA